MVLKFSLEQISSKKLLSLILFSLCLIKEANSLCDALNCPPLRGLCNNGECICENGFATVNTNHIKSNGIFCNYTLKSRYIAFVLEFFFPIGAGHFYAGKTILAGIKLGFFVLIVLSFIFMCCLLAKNRNDTNAGSIILTIIIILSLVGLILMQIFDLIGYAAGIYSDGNGVEMN